MEPHDLPQVTAMDQQMLPESNWTSDTFAAQYGDRIDRCFVVATPDHRSPTVIAFGGVNRLNPTVGQISKVVVQPRHQGKGIAQQILDILTEWAKNVGVTTLILHTRDNNVPAHRLYSKNNFTIVGKIPNYYKSLGEDGLLWKQSVDCGCG